MKPNKGLNIPRSLFPYSKDSICSFAPTFPIIKHAPLDLPQKPPLLRKMQMEEELLDRLLVFSV